MYAYSTNWQYKTEMTKHTHYMQDQLHMPPTCQNHNNSLQHLFDKSHDTKSPDLISAKFGLPLDDNDMSTVIVHFV